MNVHLQELLKSKYYRFSTSVLVPGSRAKHIITLNSSWEENSFEIFITSDLWMIQNTVYSRPKSIQYLQLARLKSHEHEFCTGTQLSVFCCTMSKPATVEMNNDEKVCIDTRLNGNHFSITQLWVHTNEREL